MHQLKHAKNWIEIEKQLILLDNKEKGLLFEKICEYYLLAEKIYEVKKIYGYGNYPHEVIKKLGLVNQIDKGADLIAERDNGELWIIQCKFRSNRKEIVPYGELATALAISDKADFRLIMTNTEALPEIVQVRGHIGTVLVDSFTRKDEKFWEGFFEWLHGKNPEKVEIKPHDYQKESIEAAKKHFATKDRGQMVMACGTGKSYVSYWVTESLGVKDVLVMVPSLALLRQLLGDWTTANKGKSFEYLCVCSDKSVAESAKEDEIDSRLFELDIPVTTKLQEVVKFLQKKRTGKMRVILSTYQSSEVLRDSLKQLNGFQFDLAVCDEAHRTAGIGGMLFSMVLSDKNIACKKRLFLTATPRIYSRGVIKRGEMQDVELCSMDDQSAYGERIYYLSFGEAIQRKLLTDYRVLAIGVNNSDFHQLLRQDELLLLKDKNGFTARAYDLAKKVALVKAARQFGIKHTLTFHARVKFAQEFIDGENSIATLFKEKENIFFGHVNGTMSSGERASILDSFKNAGHGIVSNARCLTEGVDVKAIDSVYFVDPKYKLIDIVQATGRAVRLHPGKEIGYIIVPVLINEEQDEEAVLNSSAFDQVWTVIKAMMSQDERLEEIISKVRRYQGEEALGGNRKKDLEELYVKLREKAEFIDLPKKIDTEKFERHLYLKLIDLNGRNWDYMFGQLVEWRKRNPNGWPSKLANDLDERKIGNWCSNRRKEYKYGELSEDRIKELEAMEFPWNLLTEQWVEKIKTLKEFRIKNPNRWPSTTANGLAERKLGVWCSNTRLAYKKSELNKNRIEELDALGFSWDPFTEQWAEALQELKKFRVKNPHRWPNLEAIDLAERKLGSWCNSRRGEYKKGELSKEKIKELDVLGFCWDPLTKRWVEMIKALKEFRIKNPNRWPSTTAKYLAEKKLGVWCSVRRKEYKRGELSKDRIEELNALEFSWDLFTRQWAETIRALKKFRVKNPDSWPSKEAKNLAERKLGVWSSRMRNQYKKGKLNKESIEDLASLGFSWDPLTKRWVEMIEALKKFRTINPDSWPSQTAKDIAERQLGQWCIKIRKEYNKGSLSEENIEDLASLGFSWDPLTKRWVEMIEALKKFRTINPDSWPSQTAKDIAERDLGRWCNYARIRYKKGKLGADRIKDLDAIGFKWKIK